jgi:hypothetical protein
MSDIIRHILQVAESSLPRKPSQYYIVVVVEVVANTENPVDY